MSARARIAALETGMLAGAAWQPEMLRRGGLDAIMRGPGVMERRRQVVDWETTRAEDMHELIRAWAHVEADEDDGESPWICAPHAIAFKDDRGRAHRRGGPALLRADGHREWCIEGLWHRIDGPAVVLYTGECRWYQQGRRHRSEGPAVFVPDGVREWWVHGVRHREDGPAVCHPDGREEWWLGGVQVSRDEVLFLGLDAQDLASALF